MSAAQWQRRRQWRAARSSRCRGGHRRPSRWRGRYSASKSEPAGKAGTMYPGSFDREREKRMRTGTSGPDHQECIQGVFATRDYLSSFRPPRANGSATRPAMNTVQGIKTEQSDRHEVPEGLLVVIEVGAEARQIVLKNEDAEELRIVDLHSDVPGRGEDTEERGCRESRACAEGRGSRVSSRQKITIMMAARSGATGPLASMPKARETIKDCLRALRDALSYHPYHASSAMVNSRGQRHVGRGGAGEADDSGGGGGHQRAIELKAGPETLRKR